MKHSIEFKIKPFPVPKNVDLVGPAADSFYHSTYPMPPVAPHPSISLQNNPDTNRVLLNSVKLSVLSPDQLAELCHQFRLSVFNEAGKNYQAPPTAVERVEMLPEFLKKDLQTLKNHLGAIDIHSTDDIGVLIQLANLLVSRWIE